MGLRQFKSDLAAAKTVSIDRVSGICNGDSDGEVVFSYSFEDIDPMEVRALATDVDSYPRRSGFLVFTSSEGAGKDLELFIQELSSLVEGKEVAGLIQVVSKRLTARLEGNTNSSDEFDDFQDDQGEEDALSDFTGSIDGFISDVDEDDFLDMDPLPPRRQTVTPTTYDQATLKRLVRDLKAARDAGYRVGILLNKPGIWVFSISIRVSKLGIPEEALEAWGLKERDYIVLLAKLRGGYPSASAFGNLPSDQTTIQFRFGKCVKPKPALASACEVLEIPEIYTPAEDLGDPRSQGDSRDDIFEFVHMSASLNSLLTQELPLLLKLRRELNISWDEAQTIKFNRVRTSHILQQQADQTDDLEIVVETNVDPPIQTHTPDFLDHDYAMDEGDSLNILLVATQLGLLRLVRCNQYCMVCHQKVKSAFEAVKPYVCEESLCLYQYLSLGFGQSIEHEIVNNPYVIDLLICFFYTAANNNGFREVPRGLGLMYPYVGDKDGLTPYHAAEANFQASTVRFPVGNDSSYVSMKEGDGVLIVIDRPYPDLTQSISSGNCERYQCTVDTIRGDTFTFKIMATFTTPHNVLGYVSAEEGIPINRGSGWTNVLVFRSLKDIDELEPRTQSTALAHITHTIPKVTEMRNWLIQHPGRRLSSWKDIYPSSLCLLNWIVASNRSHLVHEGLLRTQPFPESAYEVDQSKEAIETANKSQTCWMQFRFVQGSPEKDNMFKQKLESMNADHDGQHPHPTIFAWHGSPLKNWHSIIRVGLDFVTTQHGRSYGNGVYFSSSLAVSQHYCGPCLPVNFDVSWKNSVLKVRSAISICEIINQPDKFIASTPHYVVDDVSWIQCRYLYAQVSPIAEIQLTPKPTVSETKNFIAQDPGRVLKGVLNNSVEIPISALPITRRRQLMANLPMDRTAVSGDSTSNPIVIDDEESEVDADDLDIVGSGDEDDYFRPSSDRKRPHSPDSSTPNDRPAKLTTGAQEAEFNQLRLDNGPKTTHFQPGSLDLASLPRMREPTWASSSPAALRRLSRELSDLQKMQARENLRQLGWYIDFEKVDNVFQWIVELHSFDETLPLAQDMKRLGCQSIVLEIRFGASFPMAPPFVRVVRPKFIPFATGGGGHVLSGGAICAQLLTNSGWTPALSMEKVFLEVRVNISDTNPPARLQEGRLGGTNDYFIGEAVVSFRNAVIGHGWQMPPDLNDLISFETLPN